MKLESTLEFPIAVRFMTSFKAQPILFIAAFATLVTCLFVPIDATYISYIDFKTLASLFSTLAVVAAFSHIHLFEYIGQRIIRLCPNVRLLILALTFITFFGSMLLANDMALLTFLPLSVYVLQSTKQHHKMAFTFIMQNIAANLGGMLTPFGNPQNLYLYSFFHIPNGVFFETMLQPFLVATCLIAVLCLCVKSEPVLIESTTTYTINRSLVALYSGLFVFAILIVFRVVPYLLGTLVIIIFLYKFDRKALKEVNYSLLFTFFVFFIFAGNMARIPFVQHVVEQILPTNPLLVSILSCQIMSNVPSAILLSRFTTDFEALLLGVNIGGLGTLIASLASLITFNTYKKHQPNKSSAYLILFTAINVFFIVVLYFSTFINYQIMSIKIY